MKQDMIEWDIMFHYVTLNYIMLHYIMLTLYNMRKSAYKYIQYNMLPYVITLARSDNIHVTLRKDS